MKRARIVIVLVVLVLGCLSFALFHSSEPRYEGRTLSNWLDEAVAVINPTLARPHFGSRPAEDEATAWKSAGDAVRHIGTNAIPFLLKWTNVKDSSAKAQISDWFSRHPWFHIRIRRAYHYHVMASVGFRLLGSEARLAWPTLVQWTTDSDKERRYWATRCLLESKPDRRTVLPVLLQGVHDPDDVVRNQAELALADLHRNDNQTAPDQSKQK